MRIKAEDLVDVDNCPRDPWVNGSVGGRRGVAMALPNPDGTRAERRASAKTGKKTGGKKTGGKKAKRAK